MDDHLRARRRPRRLRGRDHRARWWRSRRRWAASCSSSASSSRWSAAWARFLGVVAGGLLIGETLALTGMVYDVLADVVIYLAMALVLLVRPAGTLRPGGDVRGVKGLVLAALVLATAPLYADYTPFYLGLLTEVLVFGLFALAYDVLLGHAGVLSLGHSAFLGVAAYVTGILLARYHLPLELSILAGAVGRPPHVADPRRPGPAQARRLSGDAHAGAVAGLLLRRAHVDAGDRRHRRARQPAHPLPERAARLAALQAAGHPLLRDRRRASSSRCWRSATCSARRSGA